MKKIFLLFAALLFLSVPMLDAQQPQSQTAPVSAINAKYTNGVAPGYAPTVGSGLTLNLGGGTAFCSGAVITYTAGTLSMTASTTNYVYLNTSASCAPAVKTTAFASSDIPIAEVVTSSSAITSISDVRTPFTQVAAGSTVDINGSPVSNPNINSSSPSPDSGYTPATIKGSGNNFIVEFPTSSGGSGLPVCADTSGSGTAQSCTTSPSFTPVAGQSCVVYTTTTANTGTGLTLNVNSSAADSVAKWQGSATLAAGDVAANKAVVACLDAGNNWELSTIGNAPSGGGSGNVTDGSGTTTAGEVAVSTTTAHQIAYSTSFPQYNPPTTNYLWYTDSLAIVSTANTTTATAASCNGTTCTISDPGTYTVGQPVQLVATFSPACLNYVIAAVTASTPGTSFTVSETNLLGYGEPTVSKCSGTVSGTGGTVQDATRFAPFVAQTLSFMSHGTNYDFGLAGGTSTDMVNDYTALIHPLTFAVTGNPCYVIYKMSVNSWNNPNNFTLATEQTNWNSLWASAHTDGCKVVMITPQGWPISGTLSNMTSTTDWVKSSGKTTANASSGAYWDQIEYLDEFATNYSDPYSRLSSYHFSDGGNFTWAVDLNSTMAGQTSEVKAIPACGAITDIACLVENNTFSGQQFFNGNVTIQNLGTLTVNSGGVGSVITAESSNSARSQIINSNSASGFHTYSWGNYPSGWQDFQDNSSGVDAFAANTTTSLDQFNIPSVGVYCWTSSATAANQAGDTCFSRDAAGTIDVGTGALGSKAGSMKMNNLTLTGTCTGCGGASGGTVTYTSSQTASSADNGLLVVMNCTSACAYTLPATQPSSTWSARVTSQGTTLATIALGGSDTFNGSTSVPALNSYRIFAVSANSATSTDYRGDAPILCGSNVTCTPSSNGFTVASAGGAGTGSGVEVNGGSTLTTANLNGTTPTAGTNGINATWQVSGSSVSAEIVGDGNAAHFLNGTGTFTAPSGGGGGSGPPFTVVNSLWQPLANATTFSVAFPWTTAASGNTIFVLLATDEGATITTPSGWTKDFGYTPSSSGSQLALFHKATASDTSVSIPISTTASGTAWAFELTGTRTLDTSSGNTSASAPPSAGGTSYFTTSAITPTAGAWVLAAAAYTENNVEFFPSQTPAPWRAIGFSNNFQSGSGRSLTVEEGDFTATNASTLPPLLSVSSTSNYVITSGWASVTFSIK